MIKCWFRNCSTGAKAIGRNEITVADAGSVSHMADAVSVGGKFNLAVRLILHPVRNDAVDCLAIVPSPPQLIFQLDGFSTGGEG